MSGNMKRMRKAGTASCLAVLAIFSSYELVGSSQARSWFDFFGLSHIDGPVRVDNGYYFRMHVALSHKGDPIDLTVVVGCSTRYTSHPGDSPSVETMGALRYYAMATTGGHAVATIAAGPDILSESLCLGATTSNGQVPKNWLPMVIWFDRADDLSSGIGYMTQDAYENPSSQLEFHGATVERATKQDYDEFVAKGPPNLFPNFAAGSMGFSLPPLPQDLTALVAEPSRAWLYEGRGTCRGAIRLPLTESQRQIIRPLWPQDHPKFWSIPGDYDDVGRVFDSLYYRKYSDGREIKVNYLPYTIQSRFYDFSFDGKWHVSQPNDDMTEIDVDEFRPQVFPMREDGSLINFKEGPYNNDGRHFDIKIGDGRLYRGFVYCDMPSDILWRAIKHLKSKDSLNPHDPRSCRIDGTVLPKRRYECWYKSGIAFENDEYAIVGMDSFNF